MQDYKAIVYIQLSLRHRNCTYLTRTFLYLLVGYMNITVKDDGKTTFLAGVNAYVYHASPSIFAPQNGQ
jgi:hypothetical protein